MEWEIALSKQSGNFGLEEVLTVFISTAPETPRNPITLNQRMCNLMDKAICFKVRMLTASISIETPKNKDFPSLVRTHLQEPEPHLAFGLSKVALLHFGVT
ncbi:unnamed protein product [Natator depressus]